MNVPNHEKKAFRDMTPEERSAIVEAWMSDIGCEVLRGDGGWRNSNSLDFMLDADNAYRTKPRQLIIPWDVIKPKYKWAAMDNTGNVYLYKEEPRLVSDCFAGEWCYTTILNIDTTGIDWRESLVQRQEGV